MNKFIGIGRATKDPEVRVANNQEQTKIANFTLAIDRPGKDAGADFITCTSFNKTADLIEKYVSKGTKIAVEGRIQTGSYTNKEGQKVFTTSVNVSNIEFCESKEKATATTDADGFMKLPMGVEDEGLPFC